MTILVIISIVAVALGFGFIFLCASGFGGVDTAFRRGHQPLFTLVSGHPDIREFRRVERNDNYLGRFQRSRGTFYLVPGGPLPLSSQELTVPPMECLAPEEEVTRADH